ETKSCVAVFQKSHGIGSSAIELGSEIPEPYPILKVEDAHIPHFIQGYGCVLVGAGNMFLHSPETTVYRTAFFFSKPGKSYCSLFSGSIPEIQGVSLKSSMCPGIRDAIMVIVIAGLYGS